MREADCPSTTIHICIHMKSSSAGGRGDILPQQRDKDPQISFSPLCISAVMQTFLLPSCSFVFIIMC